MSGLRKNQIRKVTIRIVYASCFFVLSLLTSAVKAESLTFDNPYNESIFLEGEKKVDSFCDGASDEACFDRYLDLVAVRHLRRNFTFYEDSLKRFSYHTYAKCLEKQPTESIEKKHSKYSNHIKKYSRNVFTWGVGQYFYKNKQWPKTKNARFDAKNFEKWLKETPREWRFLCKVLNK
jgi:hypothetical protein